LHKVKEGFTKYTFNIIDRDDDLDIDVIEKQWETTVDQGFDITLLIYGDDPFNPN
jgi:esterase/lipase superfamily enzyme